MRLLPTSLTRRTVDPNDPTGGQTIDALRLRQRALQEAKPVTPAQIASPWQGAAFMASSLANNLQERDAVAAEAAGRQRLAELMAGINAETGATPEQVGQISTLDPDMSTRLAADMMAARRAKAAQDASAALTREGWAHTDAVQQAGFQHSDEAAAAARDANAALPDSPTAKILDDFERGNYGDPATPEAQAMRDADIKKATSIQRPGSKASDLKTIYTQEDDLVSFEDTLKNMQRAKDLNPKVPVGRVAQGQATLHGNLPEGSPEWLVGSTEAADASKEFWQIMDENAIAQMSEKLKGATTDTELAQFKQILSDPSTSVEVRGKTIDRMMSLLQRKRDMAKARLDDLRSSEGIEPPPAAAPPAATAPPPPPPAAVDLSHLPEAAVLDLKNDPSPEALAEFEEFFKLPPGTAKKIAGVP